MWVGDAGEHVPDEVTDQRHVLADELLLLGRGQHRHLGDVGVDVGSGGRDGAGHVVPPCVVGALGG
jgi:hypothetical protein